MGFGAALLRERSAKRRATSGRNPENGDAVQVSNSRIHRSGDAMPVRLFAILTKATPRFLFFTNQGRCPESLGFVAFLARFD